MVSIDDTTHVDIYVKTIGKCERLPPSSENINFSCVANTTRAASLCRQLEETKEQMYRQDCGKLWSCGQNSYGELGTGDTMSRLEPTCVRIADDVDITQAVGGRSMRLFLISFPNPQEMNIL